MYGISLQIFKKVEPLIFMKARSSFDYLALALKPVIMNHAENEVCTWFCFSIDAAELD